MPKHGKPKTLICKNPACGKTFVTREVRQIYCCDACRKYVNRKECAKRRAEDLKRIVKHCAWCGKEFINNTGAKYCCDDCRKIANGRKNPDNPQSRQGRGSKPKLSLAEANALARSEGLTYGQYYNKHGYDGYFGE